MNAVVKIADEQIKVQVGDVLCVSKLEQEIGTTVTFNQVLLLQTDDKISVGNPVVSGAQVVVKILDQLKADKKIIFKKKRRKGYELKQGHRQLHTKIEIKDIKNS